MAEKNTKEDAEARAQIAELLKRVETLERLVSRLYYPYAKQDAKPIVNLDQPRP